MLRRSLRVAPFLFGPTANWYDHFQATRWLLKAFPRILKYKAKGNDNDAAQTMA
jgi:hypothetical protein